LHHLLNYLPHLLAMAVLIAASAFFSCSEAALFYLGREDRKRMAKGTLAERTAVGLLSNPERLLTSILFWNLLVNMVYFALASIMAIDLTRQGAAREASVLTVAALFIVIIFCEMLPKNIGVVWPARLATVVSLPLGAATRMLDPAATMLRVINRAAARVLFPKFEPEEYLELGDLERAINVSRGDQQLIKQERNVLRRIVAMADTRVEELMRPRLLYEAMTPPVRVADLSQKSIASGYVLLTEPHSEEIAAVIEANRVALSGQDQLGPLATPVLPVPWCASAAETLSGLDASGRSVAAVLNELGETIGIVTRGDLLGSVLHSDAVRDAKSPRVGRIRAIADGQWEVTGMTTLRRFEKLLGCELPTIKGLTVAGMLQEQLQRIPEEEDEAEWGGFRWRVLSADHPTRLTASVHRVLPPQEEQEG
jgi:Mg2+/Co2+ transporter CorB